MARSYGGSFAEGFIKSFLAAQNLQMHRQYYNMRAQMYDFQMRKMGFDPQTKTWSGIDGKKYPSYMEMMHAAMGAAQGKSVLEPYSGGSGGGGGYKEGKIPIGQMVSMAEKAGFKGDDAAHIAALAQAESGGDPSVVGKAGEIGLTQINPHAWPADMVNQARDPQGAFDAAFKVYQKQGWGAWSTDPSSPNFTPGNNGMRFLSTAQKSLTAPAGGYIGKTATGKAQPVDAQGRAVDPATGKPTQPSPDKPSSQASNVSATTPNPKGGWLPPPGDSQPAVSPGTTIPTSVESGPGAGAAIPPTGFQQQFAAQRSGAPDRPIGTSSGYPDTPAGVHSGAPDAGGRAIPTIPPRTPTPGVSAQPMMPPRTATPRPGEPVEAGYPDQTPGGPAYSPGTTAPNAPLPPPRPSDLGAIPTSSTSSSAPSSPPLPPERPKGIDPTWKSYNAPVAMRGEMQSPTGVARGAPVFVPRSPDAAIPAQGYADGGEVTSDQSVNDLQQQTSENVPVMQKLAAAEGMPTGKVAPPVDKTGYTQMMNQYHYMLANTPSLWSLNSQQAQPIPTGSTAYARGGPVLKFADGGSVDYSQSSQQPVVSSDQSTQDLTQQVASSSSGMGSAMGSDSGDTGDDMGQQEFQDNYDDAQLQQLSDEGPGGEGGMPLGMPQISDNYGNPSRAVTDGVTAGSKSLVQDHGLGQQQGAIPSQGQGESTKAFNESGGAMPKKHFEDVCKAVDPDNRLDPGMRNLAVVDCMQKYGTFTGHEQDAASAIGSMMLHFRDEAKQYGEEAVHAIEKGDINSAVGSIVQGYNQVPDGLHLNADVNKDGTVHVEQTDLHGKPVWQADVDKTQLLAAAHGLGTGIGFWSMLGQNMSKYDPENTSAQPGPEQAQYAQAEKTISSMNQQLQFTLFDERGDPIVGQGNNRFVARMPQPPNKTGIPQVDQMAESDFQNRLKQYNDYRLENNSVYRTQAMANRSDYMANLRQQMSAQSAERSTERQARAQEFTATKTLEGQKFAEQQATKRVEAGQAGMALREKLRIGAEQRKADAAEAKPFNLSDTYKEDAASGTKQSILEAAGDTALGTKTTPGVITTDPNNKDGIYLTDKQDQGVVRQMIGEVYSHSHGNIPMDTAADMVKSAFNAPNIHDIDAEPLDKNRVQITVPYGRGGQKAFVISQNTFKDFTRLLEPYHAERSRQPAQRTAPQAPKFDASAIPEMPMGPGPIAPDPGQSAIPMR